VDSIVTDEENMTTATKTTW